MNNYCVYKHTSPAGKIYIGITSKTPNKRWSNGYGYIKNTDFYSDIVKYGWDNFKHEILFTDLSQIEAWKKEKELIKHYNSYHGENGYNRCDGGNTVTMKAINKGIATRKHNKTNERKVICLNDGKIFNTIKEANEYVKGSVTRSCISYRKNNGNYKLGCATGSNIGKYPLYFAYLEDYIKKNNCGTKPHTISLDEMK